MRDLSVLTKTTPNPSALTYYSHPTSIASSRSLATDIFSPRASLSVSDIQSFVDIAPPESRPMSWLRPTFEDACIPLSYSFHLFDDLAIENHTHREAVDQAVVDAFPIPPNHLPTPSKGFGRKADRVPAYPAIPVTPSSPAWSDCSIFTSSSVSSDGMPVTPSTQMFDRPWDSGDEDDDSVTIKGVSPPSSEAWVSWDGVCRSKGSRRMLMSDTAE